MDGWSPIDLSILPPSAFDWIAQMFNAIENGCEWPDGMLHGKASSMSKTGEPTCDPNKLRVLLLLPIFYRKWASGNLKMLQSWIALWDLEGIFAGTAGKGAEDAWWMLSAMIEQANLLGKTNSGYIVDIRKCFDQISRQLASYILLTAGMPPDRKSVV